MAKIVSLFDRSHHCLLPWKSRGYDVEAYDIEPALNDNDGIKHIKYDLRAIEWIDGDFFICFPPCTEFSNAGSRLWKDKPPPDLTLVNLCFDLANRKPLIIENPRGRLSNYLGKPDLYVHPWEFSGYTENLADCYDKLTGLWLRNGAKPPVKKTWMGAVVTSNRTQSITSIDFRRSITPHGMSEGIYQGNKGVA